MQEGSGIWPFCPWAAAGGLLPVEGRAAWRREKNRGFPHRAEVPGFICRRSGEGEGPAWTVYPAADEIPKTKGAAYLSR